MNESEDIKQKTIFIDLNDRKSDNAISQSLAELNNSGYSQVSLEVKTSTEQETINLKVDIDLFSRIKKIQDLPDWVIVKLILANANLKSTNFEKRITNG